MRSLKLCITLVGFKYSAFYVMALQADSTGKTEENDEIYERQEFRGI